MFFWSRYQALLAVSGLLSLFAVLFFLAARLLPAISPDSASGNGANDLRASAADAVPMRAAPKAAIQGAAQPVGLSGIPKTFPRLWYSTDPGSPGAARLARARAYMRSHPIPRDHYQASTAMLQEALWSLLTGLSGQPDDPKDPVRGCKAAAAWLNGFNFPTSDEARWSGENAILIYDWCQGYISASDRATLIKNWNTRLADLNGEMWGGPQMAANNYYWGYLRNSLMWGITSRYENTQAQNFIAEALNRRYIGTFLTWYQNFGVGGVPREGNQYGPYMLGYPVLAFNSAKDYGYDAWSATNFWNDAGWYLQYAVTPAPTRARDGAEGLYEAFPFSDDQFFEVGGTGVDGNYADLLTAMAIRKPASALAARARQWIAKTGSQPSWWLRPELAAINDPSSPPALPLDYYAAGAQFFYGRRENHPNATTFMLQMGNVASGSAETGGVGHTHIDAGSFQLWRKGRWLSRETTGYGGTPDYYIRGLNNVANTDIREAVAHNSVLFEGRGQIDFFRGFAKVFRLQSEPGFAYAAVDLTDAYRATVDEGYEAGEDWPFAEKAIREFVYLRDLDALVIVDRLKAGSDSKNSIYNSCCQWETTIPYYTGPHLFAQQVRKSFVLHATGTGPDENGNPFVTGAGTATAKVGDQRMDLRTLLPANPAYRVIDEGGEVGQFRVEFDDSGAEISYFINVVSLRDASEPPISAELDATGDAWKISLSHPQKGSALLTFTKGLASTDGSVRIGTEAAIALRKNKQGMSITNVGPVWEGQPMPKMMSTGGRLSPERKP